MGETVTPRKGSKSAPTAAPSPLPAPSGPSTKSAPSDASAVRPFGAAVTSTKGKVDPDMKSNRVTPDAPKAGSKDSNITRSN